MDSDKEVEAQFGEKEQPPQPPQPSGELGVSITSGNCNGASGQASGPEGTSIGVYYETGSPAYSIRCGSWSPGPDTQYQCQRLSGEPAATSWTAETRGSHVEATVYAPPESAIFGGDLMKTDTADFSCG
jgi:hypothetical protein